VSLVATVTQHRVYFSPCQQFSRAPVCYGPTRRPVAWRHLFALASIETGACWQLLMRAQQVHARSGLMTDADTAPLLEVTQHNRSTRPLESIKQVIDPSFDIRLHTFGQILSGFSLRQFSHRCRAGRLLLGFGVSTSIAVLLDQHHPPSSLEYQALRDGQCPMGSQLYTSRSALLAAHP
jgi:hypothetical protein